MPAAVTNRRTVMTLFSDSADIYSHRVRVVLAEKNITVDILDSDPLHLPEDVVEVNPYGTLPTLLDRDLALYDSRIIMEYLDERYPHPPLLPIDPVSRANTRLYLHRVEKDWYSLVNGIEAGGKNATKARKELTETLLASGPIMASKPYFMSEEYSLVDATIAPLLWRLPTLGIELKGTGSAQVLGYAKRLFERPGFARSLTEAEKEMRM
ncbi:glutathione S-transferase N-terminal domain-containing protein [Solemya velum gill symbiont]|uniref:Glutathione S-transferase n=1 Tax=Solemya velum gill symbiont TaxID=2340 RepID=A0A0B0H840_SOVGS|nr:glutathione S-transferase N-terminal domain-containing protein [Solemya velum gill symbiont]KHF24039.1 glutathione S-transferase [Solemya velum gill symbiont]OOY36194.1 stringent starvation protein A [Solemya velum gill symbiont]OOY39590.1 stringent starvation protein A [Solemya velum gill symbiont]OOY46794.1 stringent starvation protein A [Solemya velum gill symbiont]OOY47981.1 stringent starvation protein A [Solemya velum gill symbiont]